MSNDFVTEIAPVGHNSGIDPSELIADEIAAAMAQYMERRDTLVASAASRTVTDNDSIGRAADTQALIRALLDAIWARAKDVAAPHSRAVETAKTRTQNFVQALQQADADLTDKIRACRDMQRRRATEQQEDQRRQEEAMRAATEVVNPQIDSSPISRDNPLGIGEPLVPKPKPKAKAPPPEPVQPVSLPAVRGDYGTRVGDRAVATYVYADVRKLPLDVLNSPGVEKAIQAALRAYAKLHPVIKGVTVSTDMATTLRRPN